MIKAAYVNNDNMLMAIFENGEEKPIARHAQMQGFTSTHVKFKDIDGWVK